MKSYLNNPEMPRGFRNNNPGNLIKTAIPWQGKLPHNVNTDSRFEQFSNFHYGLRAMIMDIHTKIEVKGLDTLSKIIPVYAPRHENNTARYIEVISKLSGFGPYQKLNADHRTLKAIIIPMVFHENGRNISASDFEAAYNMLPASKKNSPDT
jgi:hypothetical protein